MKKQPQQRIAKSMQFSDLMMMGMSSQSSLSVLMQRAYIYSLWEGVVGQSVSKCTQSIFYKDKKLFIELSSSVARNELLMLRKDIIQRINEKAKMELISELFLR
ncbi:MAG: DUF721 domain-containing protein [Bacteroidales bacterium]